jgi:glycosyltransferase involved in cell wall biosynthesis
LTKNEQENLPECLACLTWADETLVVDSFSTDATMEIATRLATRAIQHPFSNFAAQHNYAQGQARHDWVLFVDADERVTPELRDEIISLAQADRLAPCTAYHIRREHLFSGHWFRYDYRGSLTADLREGIRRSETPRLLDRRQAAWTRPLHETVEAPEPHGVLAGAILHYSGTNLSFALETFNHYTDLEAAHLHATRSKMTVPEAMFRGVRSFVYHYLFAGLWRHGQVGLIFAAMNGYTKFMNYAKLWERLRIEAGQGEWTARDRQLLHRLRTADEDAPTVEGR